MLGSVTCGCSKIRIMQMIKNRRYYNTSAPNTFSVAHFHILEDGHIEERGSLID